MVGELVAAAAVLCLIAGAFYALVAIVLILARRIDGRSKKTYFDSSL